MIRLANAMVMRGAALWRVKGPVRGSVWLLALLSALSMVVFTVRAWGQDFDYRLHARSVARGVYVLVGATEDFNRSNGGNIVNTGFIAAPGGWIVVDTGPSLHYGTQMRQAMAALSDMPVAMVFNTHHHPDHFLGNLAFAASPIAALDETRQGIARDGNAFAENLYRMSGDWLQGTEVLAPTIAASAGERMVAGRKLRLLALKGHTGSDLAVYDETSGVLFAGDLVFNERAPTTPHADIAQWLQSLDQLEALTSDPGFRVLVPGHGQPATNARPIERTRRWLTWLRDTLSSAAARGLDMNEVLRLPLPPEFAGMAQAQSEYRRSVVHLFPGIEQRVLMPSRGP